MTENIALPKASILILLALFLVPGAALAQGSAPPVSTPAPPAPAIDMPQPLTIPPPAPTQTPATVPMPFPTLPPVPLDATGDSIGIAQETAHARGLQARILWLDGTANISSINTADKIHALVQQAKASGFNMIVFDVKPIIGYTLYPSRYAPKLTDWKGATLPPDFDPLAVFVQEAHAAGLQLIANMSTFGEGHKYFDKGPAYNNPEWQTILYEATRTVRAPLPQSPTVAIAPAVNALPQDNAQLALYTDPSQLRKDMPGATVDVVNFDARVIAQVDGAFLSDVKVSAPPQGALLAGAGAAGDFLRSQTHVGDILTYQSNPQYVPITQAPEQKITVFVNPNDPTVQQHELDIVREIVTNYAVDGIIFDDRMRFAAVNADFSPLSQAAFEQYLGHKINWPNDVFQINPYPNQPIIKGPFYQDWLVWRALTIRNWLAEARATVKAIRPQATVSVYVGSWYGQYDLLGSNWAADDFDAPFDFLTPAYQKTGYAGLLDWLTTGCYYSDATIAEGSADGDPGATVEAAGQLSNRAVNDHAWVYAGLYMATIGNDPETLARCLQAAAASTQGIMVFDLSQVNQYNLWPVFAQAFAVPAVPPQEVPGLLDMVRRQHERQKKAGIGEPPVTIYSGVENTGL